MSDGVPVSATDELRRQIAEVIADYHGRMIQAHTLFSSYELAGELLPLVVAVVAEARTEALNEVAEILSKPGVIWHGDDGVTVRTDPTWREPDVPLVDWIRQRVAAIREGGNQNAEPERHKVCTCWRLNPAGTHQRGCDFFVADQKGTEQ